jgi:hypothetical protein
VDKDFSLLHSIQTSSGAHLASGVPSSGLKQLGHETDHSPPSSAEIKNYTSTPHMPLWCDASLIKQMDNFIHFLLMFKASAEVYHHQIVT